MWLLQVPLTHAALWGCAGLQLEHQQLRSLNPAQDGALIYRADMQSTLHEVVLYGFLQPNAAGYTHVSRTAPGGCSTHPLPWDFTTGPACSSMQPHCCAGKVLLLPAPGLHLSTVKC